MMPENKPMKMQWLNIDGRQVPSILPNHWNEQKNDWDITGTKNPLPIANYTQNASGVWLPTSESNPMPTQLTGSIVENYNGEDVVKTKSMGMAYTGWLFNDSETVTVTAGSIATESSYRHVNGFSTLAYAFRDTYSSSKFKIYALWIYDESFASTRASVETLHDASGTAEAFHVGNVTTKSMFVRLRIENKDATERVYHFSGLLRA